MEQAAATAVHGAAGGGNGGGAKQESVDMLMDNEDVKAYIRNCRAYDVSSTHVQDRGQSAERGRGGEGGEGGGSQRPASTFARTICACGRGILSTCHVGALLRLLEPNFGVGRFANANGHTHTHTGTHRRERGDLSQDALGGLAADEGVFRGVHAPARRRAGHQQARQVRRILYA